MITSKTDPIVFEVTATLQEWHQIWKSLYLDNQLDLLEKVGHLIESLVDLRVELITLTKHSSSYSELESKEQQISQLKLSIITKLDQGSRLLGLDLIPRDINLRPVDPIEISPTNLYRLHVAANSSSPNFHNQQEYSSSSSSSVSSQSDGNFTSHKQCHLQLAIKNHNFAILPQDEIVEIYVSLVETTTHNSSSQYSPLSYKFLTRFKNNDLMFGVPNTVFTNIGEPTGRDLSLCVQVYRVGRMLLNDGSKTTFVKQTSHSSTSQDGSTSSLTSVTKYTSNGPSRNRNSTICGLNSMQTYRRPLGVTIISLNDYLINNCMFKSNNIVAKVGMISNESEFSHLNDLYPKRTNPLKTNQNVPSIQIDMSFRFLFCSQDHIPRLLNGQSYCITEKRGFPDIVMPSDFKNDLYLTLEGAEFEKGGKSIPKNIEASVSLIGKSGIIIENCISPGSNCDNISTYKSCILYHSNSPKWNEDIKINVPLSEFDTAHIRIEFRHCSTKDRDKKFIGFAFLPLSNKEGAVIPDKSHELYLYKFDSQAWEDDSLNLCKYVSLPYGPSAKVMGSGSKVPSNQYNFSHSSREIVTVSTILLSTKLTQNTNLLNLLKWRELVKRNNNDFEDALKKVLVLQGEEIVKFLQDILDTLFDTFTLYSTSEDDYSALIFKVLIHIFLLLEEPKYQHFKPVLDTYASAHFSATLVYKGLLACINKCLEFSSVVEKQAPIQRCFQSIKYIFQFIVRSKLLYTKATGEHNDDLFLKDLKHLFKLFELMLANSNAKLIPIQVTFLESFPGALEQLAEVVCAQELVRVVTSLAQSVGFRLPPALSRAKLIFMREIANSTLIKNQDTRLLITENFCRHLDSHIRQSEDLELCYAVLEALIVKVHDYHWPLIRRLHQLTMKSASPESSIEDVGIMTVGEIDISSMKTHIQANHLDLALISLAKELEPFVNLVETLLQLLDLILRDNNNDKVLAQKYCSCLLTIMKLMGEIGFEHYVKRRKMEYSKLCNLFRALRDIFDRDWSVMQITSHAILEHPVNRISKDVRLRTDSHPLIRQANSYIKLIVDFITHPTLQLEIFSERKKTYVSSTFGDLRIKFAAQLLKFWSELPRETINELTLTSVHPLLDAVMLPNDRLQKMLLPIFYDMIEAENQFKSIERCLIDNIDLFMGLNRGDIKFIEKFECILKRKMKEKAPPWEQRGLRLINSLVQLMYLLHNYRKSSEDGESRSKRMSCLVDLSNYYKSQERMDIYLRYLFRLCDMHLEAGNHTEAAFTVKQYADEIKWHNRILNPIEGFRPEEQEWSRKEALYQRIIQYFDLGKCWEEAIPLCKELASFYENFLVDYEKVSNTLKRLASFLDNILNEHRPEREYFRVEFLGTDLPDFVRGKEMIYRGGEYERLASFIQRLLVEFPDAKVLSSKGKQTLTKDSLGQFLVISNVKAVPFVHDHFKTGQRNINEKIIQYYLNNRLDTFSYDLPVLKIPPGHATQQQKSSDTTNDYNVKHLWLCRYVLKLKKQLPDILPWSEVVSQDCIEISPINHAIETISAMNLELSKLILSYKNEPSKPISPLTMRLQGVIEAAVNGGPAVFVNAFLKQHETDAKASQAGVTSSMKSELPEFGQTDPELFVRLRDLIKQQFSILDTGLALHSKLAPPEVMPLQSRLYERLESIKNNLLGDADQIIESNYELMNQNDHSVMVGLSSTIRSCKEYRPLNASSPSGVVNYVSSQKSSDGSNHARDETDGHDVNGNIYGEIDDQIYSQPNESLTTTRLISNGSRSELSSPSRQLYGSGTSSLSTLAVLSNLPLNRQQRLSLTPSKDPSMHLSSPISSALNADACIKASRKLSYDGCRNILSGTTAGNQNGNKQVVVKNSTTSSIKDNDAAPPLPPRLFLSNKQTLPRSSLSRSQGDSLQ